MMGLGIHEFRAHFSKDGQHGLPNKLHDNELTIMWDQLCFFAPLIWKKLSMAHLDQFRSEELSTELHQIGYLPDSSSRDSTQGCHSTSASHSHAGTKYLGAVP